ncbi:RING finger protein 10 [Porphyridium purpureum]|uniref:RING finger protein 10 n=1 Tax=Porphyridium purpureum TaxID=35688 RepID=A0A5J4YXF8_PORPP|nr:RING finger protein 10 [Porphyridium purpureum]|eukprot:POR5262..scf209_3
MSARRGRAPRRNSGMSSPEFRPAGAGGGPDAAVMGSPVPCMLGQQPTLANCCIGLRPVHCHALVHAIVNDIDRDVLLARYRALLLKVSADTEATLDWELVELVYVRTRSPVALSPRTRRISEEEVDTGTRPTCAICLDEVTAPRVTPCGHLFCLVCLIQMFAHESRRCPLCSVTLAPGDLRRVRYRSTHAPQVGERLEMRLLIRKRKSLLLIGSADGCGTCDGSNGTFGDSALNGENVSIAIALEAEAPFSRICFCNEQDVLDAIREDMDALLAMRNSAQHGEIESVFESLAQVELDKCRDYRKVVKAAMKKSAEGTASADRMKLNAMVSRAIFARSAASTGSGNMIGNVSAGHLSSSRNCSGRGTDDVDASVYWFQTCDGQNVFLAPISFRMLLHHYGDVGSRDSQCPSLIDGKLLRIEYFIMSPETRKRFKFLAHLPLGCEFGLCELDLRSSGLISDETASIFADELAKSTAKRERVLKQQKRREDAYHEHLLRKEKESPEFLAMHAPGYWNMPAIDLATHDLEQFPSILSNEPEAENGSSNQAIASNISEPGARNGEGGSPPEAGRMASQWGNGSEGVGKVIGSNSPYGSYATITGTAGGYFPPLPRAGMELTGGSSTQGGTGSRSSPGSAFLGGSQITQPTNAWSGSTSMRQGEDEISASVSASKKQQRSGQKTSLLSNSHQRMRR